MYFEIAAIAAVIIFAVLTIYVIRTLLSLQQTLKRIDLITLEMNLKLKQLDSTINTVSNIGDVCEEKTARMKSHYLEKKACELNGSDYSDDLAEWLIASVKLGSKFIRRK